MQIYTLPWLTSRLLQANLIDDAVAREIAARAPEHRARYLHQKFAGNRRAISRYKLDPGEVVASMGVRGRDGQSIDQELISKVLAEAADLPWEKIDPLNLDMDLAINKLPKAFALRNAVIPLRRKDTGIVIAVADPFDDDVTASLQRLGGSELHRVVASKDEILRYLTELLGFHASVESAALEADDDPLADFEQLVRVRSAGEIEANDRHVVNAVDFLLTYAFDQRASDLHIEPRRDKSHVRLRIDGILHGVRTYPRSVHAAVVSRIKSMARLDIAEKRRPQDGRIKTILHDKSVELRISTMPVAFGEKVVIRIFDPGVLTLDLTNLGFEGEDLALFTTWIHQPNGLVLVTGPTGSGKSTTLYTALRLLSDDRANIISVEDPIEMVTDHFNQVAVQPKIGVDFATALRTILRQDPDIIMVGEIRDGATAEMAAQAALTGHMVLSTLHTNDTIGAITRLHDQGLPAYVVASTLRGVMAQRLVRRICHECRVVAPPTEIDLSALGLASELRGHLPQTATGKGCGFCRGTGYRGRIGIFELLAIRGRVANLVRSGELDEQILRGAATEAGMKTLHHAALSRLARGVTSVEEVIRVTGRLDGLESVLKPAQDTPFLVESDKVVTNSVPHSDTDAEVDHLSAIELHRVPTVQSPDHILAASAVASLQPSLATQGDFFPQVAVTVAPTEVCATTQTRMPPVQPPHPITVPPTTVPPRSALDLLARYGAGERSFSGAQLAGADLFGVDLLGVDLADADLKGAFVTDARLVGARLRGACLIDADLRWSDLSGADLRGSDLTGARLDGARIVGAQHDAETRWPHYEGDVRPWSDDEDDKTNAVRTHRVEPGGR